MLWGVRKARRELSHEHTQPWCFPPQPTVGKNEEKQAAFAGLGFQVPRAFLHPDATFLPPVFLHSNHFVAGEAIRQGLLEEVAAVLGFEGWDGFPQGEEDNHCHSGEWQGQGVWVRHGPFWLMGRFLSSCVPGSKAAAPCNPSLVKMLT